MTNNINKTEFLTSLKLGESAAFEDLYRQCYPMIKKLIKNNNGKDNDAQDVLQEALFILVKNLRKEDFNLKVKVTTYLYAVARNLWLNKLRGSKRETSLFVDNKEIDVPDVGSDELVAKYEYEEKHETIAQKLTELKEDCRKLISSYYTRKKSLGEIAAEMGYTPAFVKVKKNRCMNALRKKVEEIYS